MDRDSYFTATEAAEYGLTDRVIRDRERSSSPSSSR